MRRNAALIFAALAALGSRGFAHPDSGPAPDPASKAAPNRPNNPIPDQRAMTATNWKGDKVTVAEKLGAQIPLDARFRTADGAHVTLGEVMRGGLPAILTFNYSDCPMLCSLQLNGLSTALPQIADKSDGVMLRPGAQFRIVTIDLEPGEPLEKIQKMRDKYIARLPENQRESAKAGWTFLLAENPGDGTQIHRVADSVGFSYMYIPERAEWAHPAALIFLASSGVVTRYVYGIEFPPAVMRESIFKAGTHEPASAVGFLNRCYHYDPDANSHARAGMLALRIGAGGMILLLLSGFGLAKFLKRHRRNEVSES
ncbi:MAG: SCO family protein [Kofleriaceae bacterium]